MPMLYANVIVPVPLPALFTYIVPDEMVGKVKPLYRVVVPFGNGRKFYTGIVTEITDSFEGNYELRSIAWCPDDSPILRRPQLKLWEWLADYYMCAIGDVMKAALPSGLKLESETIIEINKDYVAQGSEKFTSEMIAIWEALKTSERMSVKEIERLGINSALNAAYRMLALGAVEIREKHSERFRPKRTEFFRILIDRENPEAITSAFKKLRSARHQNLLMLMLQLSDFTKKGFVLKDVWLDSIKDAEFFDRSILRSFESKGLISIHSQEVSRFKWHDTIVKPLPILSTAQKTALNDIHNAFSQNNTVLLHGVTSSGKTEIYIHLIDFILRQGRQILFLVPEIALTTQLTTRLQNVFGSKVIIYHSRFSDAERVEIWLRLLRSNEPQVIIGARSAVFLPFASLGLVIVDEEHEQSYKQFDPAPRYNARDVAIVLSRMYGAKTLLASATPSIETYYKALTGRYGLVTLSQRYGDVTLPEIEIVDMDKERSKGSSNGSISAQATAIASEALKKDNQIIFFHNRRGFAPIARCKACACIPRCTDCSVALSYHKRIDRLVCHYCGKEYALPKICPQCSEPSIEVVGFGTERIEDDVAEAFPNARVLRMDLDSTRNKENYADIIDRFSQHKADILVGTQMVTKGLDFGDVSTVVVINADMLLNYPDFRATERAFNMLEQVSGRAGRRPETPGNVIIQTRQASHPVLEYVLQHDYINFYHHELEERKSFGYPPFTRLIYIFVRHKDALLCNESAHLLTRLLKEKLGNRVLGPHEPSVNRIKTMYIRRIMIKAEPEVSISQIKNIIKVEVAVVRSDSKYRNADIYFDVDPM